LYFRENRYPDKLGTNAYLQLLADGGYMVEALTKAHYPGAVQLSYGRDPGADFAETLRLLQTENIVLFEATIIAGRRMARIDIIEKRGPQIRLIEAKAKSFDGDEHRQSLANDGVGVFRGSRRPHEVASHWREKIEDVAFQLQLFREVMPDVEVVPWLALVDKSKTAAIDRVTDLFALDYDLNPDGARRTQTARYLGTIDQLAGLDLITEVDVSKEVDSLLAEVSAIALDLEERLDAPLDSFLAGLERDAHCRDCEFRTDVDKSGFRDCWGPLASPRPHLLELFSIGTARAPDGRSLASWGVRNSRTGLLDVPIDGLAKRDGSIGPIAARQRRQIEYTRRNETYIGSDLHRKLIQLQGPLHFIDFEGSRLALPYHAGMRPYGNVAFQWSCHTVDQLGDIPVHSEWLNSIDAWPNQAFAESLRAAIGDSEPVLTWSGYEANTLREIVSDLVRFGRDPSPIAEWVDHLIESRIIDLHEWAKSDFFHPAMKGKTGIKFVLDALWPTDPEMRRQFTAWTGLAADASSDPYAALPAIEIKGVSQSVHEGTGAMRAYQEMMYGSDRHDIETRDVWARLLKQYCHIDTLSMVLILEHWRRLVLN
jgi:hypothetical protein